MASGDNSNACMNKTELKAMQERIDKELGNVMSFWLQYSHDSQNGGFFNCLYEAGKVYDDLKYVWLQGRQVWMYCRLYNELERFRKDEILEVAKKAADFLQSKVKRNDNRCYFCVTADGKPVKLQRTIFSECFYVMAMSEVGRATQDNKYKDEACNVLDSILSWVMENNLPDGQPKLEGAPLVNSLSVPMMIFCIVYDICYSHPELTPKYGTYKDWAVEKILQHLQRNEKVVLEMVSEDGKELPGSAGRLTNCGHVLEAGWFLLQHALDKEDEQLKKIAIDKFIKLPFELGWDQNYGGLYYFLDVDGFSPVQLEWNLKLWWPQCEALIAFLMAYKVTNDRGFLTTFKKILDYTLEKFSDPLNGEWYGYLSQKGTVTHNFKGSPYKGCFHIPRALYMCHEMLLEINEKRETEER